MSKCKLCKHQENGDDCIDCISGGVDKYFEPGDLVELYVKSQLDYVLEENKKLKLMIDNGLGWEDLKNDI